MSMKVYENVLKWIPFQLIFGVLYISVKHAFSCVFYVHNSPGKSLAFAGRRKHSEKVNPCGCFAGREKLTFYYDFTWS